MTEDIDMPLSMGNYVIPFKREALNSAWQLRVSSSPLVPHIKVIDSSPADRKRIYIDILKGLV